MREDDDGSGSPQLLDDWVADPIPDRGFCVRHGLNIINAVLLVAAITLIVVGSLASQSSITAICSQCSQTAVAATAIGVIFLVTSVVGFLAMRKRAVGILVAYVVVLIALVFAILGITIASTVYTVNGIDLSSSWRSHVADHSSVICNVQQSYSCSGWAVCCGNQFTPAPTPSPTTPVPGTDSGTDTCEWKPGNCLSACVDSNMYEDSCKNSVQKWLRTILIPFMMGMVFVLAMILGGGVFSFRLRNSVRSSTLQ
eukprot:TRINITY_DN19276_c0_g1_i1.p1 TRINITY_DN19276_c0_g1~~TRINITY_DN19276_c0_g1_i1.p1  ORF type:complete len:278 (+),score=27.89 TRINITY_DN19276_c0_g1_i1:70-834(+)